ncbi:Amidohydrolase [Pleurostoma richardsiae]|uniref:Amidohydrolase n=1 Tax=Pleurostoma richardsiae TaxID=41990 RepID=A0AA38RQ96_9PEZI|nr:Amidohydrolase [Pleurostoma richardsiae]
MACHCCATVSAVAPTQDTEVPSPFTIHTSKLFDPLKLEVLSDISIRVNPSTSLIEEVYKRTEALGSIPDGDIDLRGKFVMPGFVDAHTHIFLHSYWETPSAQQKRDESFVERIVRSVNHCKTALLAGYTTYRDLGSESMQEADANVRDAINRGLMVGPRLFVATKVLASTASYEPRNENYLGGTRLPAGGDAADGIDEVRKAVRRRIGAGADIIKFYADYRRRLMRAPPKQQHPYIAGIRFPNSNDNPDCLVYSEEEMSMIVREANMADAPAVAHAITKEGILTAVKAGALTIEHGYYADEECFEEMIHRGTLLVPTLAIAERMHAPRFKAISAMVKSAFDSGVKLACGGDTGTFTHGDNAREMELMVEAGVPVLHVLAACTRGGWEACGGLRCGKKFGWIEKGVCADLVGLDADPTVDKTALRKVDFVMKDAQVYKQDGHFMPEDPRHR